MLDAAETLASMARASEPRAPTERATVAALAYVALTAMRRGSTRLSLHAPEGVAFFLHALSSVVAETDAARVQADVVALLAARRGAPIIGYSEHDYAPLLVVGQHVYIQKMLNLELRLVEALKARLSRPRSSEMFGAHAIESALLDVVARPSIGSRGAEPPTEEQQQALVKAARRPLLLISGGPGTGKTSIVVGLLRVFGRLGFAPSSIALAAPTGKAAHRLTEAITRALTTIRAPSDVDDALRTHGMSAETLHRLLGYDPGRDRFRHHENNPLSERLIIVDESSMLDLAMVDQLLRATTESDHLILLGDRDQLPPIEAGAFLSDFERIDQAARRFSVHLTHSHRMDARDPAGRALLLAARAVRDGDQNALSAIQHAPTRDSTAAPALPIRTNMGALRRVGAEVLGAEDMPALLDAWFEENFDLGVAEQPTSAPTLAPESESEPEPEPVAGLLRAVAHRVVNGVLHMNQGRVDEHDIALAERWLLHLEDFRILCVTRTGGSRGRSAEAINARLHARWLQATAPESRAHYLPGEPIIMQRNDYERSLFNGDTGAIFRIAVDGRAPRAFAGFRTPAGLQFHRLEFLDREIDLAYALTIHRAQGSEFKRALLIIPEEDSPLLTRELLYTGLTRSKTSVVVCGAPKHLTAGIQRRVQRDSGIGDRLTQILARDGHEGVTQAGDRDGREIRVKRGAPS